MAEMINNIDDREILLEIKDLTTRFYTEEGLVYAVNGVSYQLEEGEVLGVVGESGCGKSVHALSIMGLIPSPPGKIERGEVLFDGRDLLKFNQNELRDIRGSQIAMVFQDPMTSLNPVYTVGFQITEALAIHKGMGDQEAREVAGDLLAKVGIPAPIFGWHAPASHDRHGALLRSETSDRGRAYDSSRCYHPGSDHRPGETAPGKSRHGGHVDHPRPGGGG